MSIERISFTSSLLDKARFNTQLKPTEPEKPAEEAKEKSVDIAEDKNTEAQNEPETEEEAVAVYTTEPQKHTARNWTIGLSAAAVLTGLGVLAGRHGYLGDGVQKLLKGAKKEAGELIDDVSESVTGSINRATGEAPVKPAEEASGTVLGRIDDESENVGFIFNKGTDDSELLSASTGTSNEGTGFTLRKSGTVTENEGSVLGRASEEEGSVLGRNSDDLVEDEPLISSTTVDEAEESVSSVLPKIDDEPLIIEDAVTEIFSKDGKFKIPMSSEEVNIKATRKYLKAKKIKVPKKYRKLPEFKIEDVIGDFKPENIDKSKIVDGVYVHQLPKGERLEVHLSTTNDFVSYIERYNKKGKLTGKVKYNVFNSGVDYVEHPNGFRYDFTWDASAISRGSRTVGKNTYFYDESGKIKRLEQKISDSVERKVTFEEDGKINYLNYFVNTSEGKKLVKEDMYFHGEKVIREFFNINGDTNNYVSNKIPISKSFLQRLKFWQSDGFKKFWRDITEEEDF